MPVEGCPIASRRRDRRAPVQPRARDRLMKRCRFLIAVGRQSAPEPHPDALARRRRQRSAQVGLNPTRMSPGAISIARSVQMKENNAFSFMIEHHCLVQRP